MKEAGRTPAFFIDTSAGTNAVKSQCDDRFSHPSHSETARGDHMLTKVRVRNFKSLKDVTLELDRRNVLVGANMAGKSNVIDLFRFVYDMAFPPAGSMGLTNAFVTRGGFSEVLWKGGDERTIQLSLSGTTLEHGPLWQWNYEILVQGEARYDNFRISSERLSVQRPDSPAADELVENVGNERHLCNIQHQRLLSTPDSGRSILEFENPSWPGNFLRSTIAKWRFYELVPASMRSPNQTAATAFLQKYGENLSQWLSNLALEHHNDSFARIERILLDTLPQVTGLFNLPTQQSTVALGSREKCLNRPVTLSQMSSGELTFIALLSLIYAPAERTGTLYCIEELENYLHPRLIDTLLEVMRQVQEQWEGNENAPQLIVTTHSPLVVDKTKLSEIVFVEKREGATICTRPNDKPQLQKLLENAEVGLGDLVYSGALSNVGK
jgi:predicted ATPase